MTKGRDTSRNEGRALARRNSVRKLSHTTKRRTEEEEFMSYHPSEFHGSTDPSVTWGWLMSIESIFLAIRVAERHKIKYVTGIMKGPALDWWNEFSRQMGRRNALDMGWVGFRAAMIREYRLEEYVKGLEEEFLTFKLLWLSIDKYTEEFRRMLHLVRHIVHSAKDEVRFYAQGLPEVYRVYVERQRWLDLAILCAKEVDWKEVPTYEKAEEAERQRAKKLREDGIKDDKCPRCGQICGLIIECSCLDLDCEDCGDWRHTSARCPKSK